MHNQITLPLVLALGLRVVLASPVPVIEPPTTCAYPIESYTADTQTLQNGTPFIGAVSISGASGGTLSLTESYRLVHPLHSTLSNTRYQYLQERR